MSEIIVGVGLGPKKIVGAIVFEKLKTPSFQIRSG